MRTAIALLHTSPRRTLSSLKLEKRREWKVMETKNRISWTLALVALVGAALAALIFGSPLAHVSAASPPVRAVSFRPDVLANSQSTEVIASGLNNPRGLSFGPEGALYAAEAGSGG